MSEGWFTILGVAVGFGLAELTLWLKNSHKETQLQKALISELKSIVAMVPSKDAILVQALEKYKTGHVMPVTSTRFPRLVYDQLMSTSPTLVSQSERECLHVAYERLRVMDFTMDTVEERFNSITTAHGPLHAVNATVRMLVDLREALSNTAYLVQSVLDKKPIDVFKIENRT